MAKKIHSVVLKELEIIENGGEYIEHYRNERKVPLFITNHSLRRARDFGIIETSMLSDLVALVQNTEGKKTQETTKAVLSDLSEEKMLNVIYVAYLGANPKATETIDDFVELYHGSYLETVQLYTDLITATVTGGDNNFASSLRKHTRKPKAGEKK